MTEVLLTNVEGYVGTLTFNRPERHNAFDDELTHRFEEALDAFAEDPMVRCILIRGEGRSFCSGRDVASLGARPPGKSDFEFVRHHQLARFRQLETPKPIVAALKGGVLGGGCEIALACDIRVSSTNLKMGMPEIHFGLLPDTGGTQLLTLAVGASRAKYMTLTGANIDASTALAWGAVDFVVEPDELDERAAGIAAMLAAKPPIALAIGKQIINQAGMTTIRNGINQELVAATALFGTQDYQEARSAFREKRTPNYKGL